MAAKSGSGNACVIGYARAPWKSQYNGNALSAGYAIWATLTSHAVVYNAHYRKIKPQTTQRPTVNTYVVLLAPSMSSFRSKRST